MFSADSLGALIFVPALAGCAIVGFILAIFAANAFLTILQATGAGAKVVEWPGEAVTEHFWKVFYLAWIIGLWAGPAVVLGRRLGHAMDSAFLASVLPFLIVWLCFPVSQLSSLSAPTIWLPVWPEVFARLAQKPAITVQFYGLSAVVLVGFGLGWQLTFAASPVYGMFVGPALLMTCWFLYARLLGRLAFLLVFARPTLRKKRVKGRKPAIKAHMAGETEAEPKPAPPDAARITQPSEMPPLNSPDVGPLHGYDVRLTDPEPPPPPPAPPIVEILEELPADHDDDDPVREATERRRRSFDRSRRWDDEDDDASPYIAHAPEVQDEERAPKELVKPTEMEMRLIRRDDSRRKPRRAWTADLYLFLLHPAASSSLIWLTLLCFCVGGLVRIMREFRPAVDG